jgi:hypothetical protein
LRITYFPTTVDLGVYHLDRLRAAADAADAEAARKVAERRAEAARRKARAQSAAGASASASNAAAAAEAKADGRRPDLVLALIASYEFVAFTVCAVFLCVAAAAVDVAARARGLARITYVLHLLLLLCLSLHPDSALLHLLYHQTVTCSFWSLSATQRLS